MHLFIGRYESAKLVDTVVNGFLHFIHRITSFFHIHWHPPYIHLEDHLVEFKSSNPRKVCSELASYTAMFLVFPRMSWSPHICPIMRYFYGTPIDTILTPFVGWSSYDWSPEGWLYCPLFWVLRHLPLSSFGMDRKQLPQTAQSGYLHFLRVLLFAAAGGLRHSLYPGCRSSVAAAVGPSRHCHPHFLPIL